MLSFIIDGKRYLNYSLEDISGLVESGLISLEAKDEIIRNAKNEESLKNRELAYKKESDPLYMEWQFDQTEESELAWRDKVAEIKARYSLSDENI